MRSSYNTKQKDAVRLFLLEHADRSYTASEIYSAVSANGVGRTTVYRALAALEKDGVCAKYPGESGTSDCYQYLDRPSCREHIHYICNVCGKVGHLDCSFMNDLRSHVEGGHGFTIDSERTVIYGICSGCKAGGGR